MQGNNELLEAINLHGFISYNESKTRLAITNSLLDEAVVRWNQMQPRL